MYLVDAWQICQVHYQECLHLNRPSQHQLLQISLERFLLGYQTCWKILLSRYDRINHDGPRKRNNYGWFSCSHVCPYKVPIPTSDSTSCRNNYCCHGCLSCWITFPLSFQLFMHCYPSLIHLGWGLGWKRSLSKESSTILGHEWWKASSD